MTFEPCEVNTVDDALRALVDRGFRYLRAPGYGAGDAQVEVTLLYVLGWEAPYLNAVHVRAEDDATAIRVRSDAPPSPTRPAERFSTTNCRARPVPDVTEGQQMTATAIPEADPFAPVGTRFALDGASFTHRSDDVASPCGIRPFGLRRALPARPGRALPNWTYDERSQKAVDSTGRPLIDSPLMGDPSADTTSSTDGEDGPSAEDWNND